MYSEFNLPTSMLLYDQLIIPITIHNLFRTEKQVRVTILETIIDKEKILQKLNGEVTVAGKNQTKFFYNFDTSRKDLQEGDEIQISATIALLEN